MKNFLLILTPLFLTLTAIHAQTNVYHPFPDSNATWNITETHYFFPHTEYYSIIISGDTLINSQIYHKLATPYVEVVLHVPPYGTSGHTGSYRGAVRQDIINKKVFFIPASAGTEQLLYDFNMQVGDTVKGYIGDPSLPVANTVQSIDSVLVGSNYRKKWNIDSVYKFSFIEGIGSTYGVIKESPTNKTDQPDCSITCFKQNGITLYPATATNCELVTSVNSIDENQNYVTVFPNPFSTKTVFTLNKQVDNASLKVSDLFGKEQKSINFSDGQAVFEKGNLSGGIYFYEIISDNKNVLTGKLVIQ